MFGVISGAAATDGHRTLFKCMQAPRSGPISTEGC